MLVIVSQMISPGEALNLNPIPRLGSKSTTVRITNFVGISTRLNVHCSSTDDDLGKKELSPMATYKFGFRTRVRAFGFTVFRCTMEWPGVSHRFEIYNQKNAKFRLNCWLIKPSGPCLCDCKDPNCTYNEDCYKWQS